jgi:hypothetical protein
VSGHFYLGDDRDVSRPRVPNDVLVVLLREKASGSAADLCERSYCGQLRTRVDLNSPALIVGEMEVQDVELVERHDIDVLLDLPHGQEMACDVEHSAAPAKARLVHDSQRWHGPDAARHAHVRFDLDRQKLPDRLDAMEEAGR